ncbi:ligand-binding sensor domain-containing protein [Membranihabitans marinus]|uniref:hypothetical protein n=1 Tax=Membranihabitans marinus TaxID=1227546 RepID=UPI001F29ABEB|nr:hypothetical protein [Membranihabitans marinus]
MTKLLLYLLILVSTLLRPCFGQDSNHGHHDTSFIQEIHVGHTLDPLDESTKDVRAIHVDELNNVWAATKNGVFCKKSNSNEWTLITTGHFRGPAYDVQSDSEGTIWMATWMGVISYDGQDLNHWEGLTPPIAKISADEEGVIALGPKGFWQLINNQWKAIDVNMAHSIRSIESHKSDGYYVSTDVGLYHLSDGKAELHRGSKDMISAYIRSTDYASDGRLWVGGLGGISIWEDDDKIHEIRPSEGLPNGEVRVVKQGPDQAMWIGTDYGISWIPSQQDEYRVYLSPRWLVGNQVRDIDFDREGHVWVATDNGISQIKRNSMTLAEKSEYYYNRLINRFIRPPWIPARLHLENAGDTTSFRLDDDDNDGEFTSNYLVMESLRYAVTKDSLSRERAKKAFDFLYLLREVTGDSGFFARTVIPVDWTVMHDHNRIVPIKERADALVDNPRQKFVEERWHVSADGQWRWKGDTSSDEICGHFFGYYFYYNLVADESEKKKIAHHVSKILDHLLANDFNLTDVDGRPTKWGIWSPNQLNNNPDWTPERALNSMELLSFFKLGSFMTGNHTYEEIYHQLIDEHGYWENAQSILSPDPAFNTYFDIFLTAYLYPVLIQQERNPDLLRKYKNHLDKWFVLHRKSNSPFINFLYNYLGHNREGLKESITFLQDSPLDLVDYHIDNSLREDVVLGRSPILEEIQTEDLRPVSEYRTIRWDVNPFIAKAGNPHQEREPVFWLLPYYLGRYIDLIQAE